MLGKLSEDLETLTKALAPLERLAGQRAGDQSSAANAQVWARKKTSHRRRVTVVCRPH